MKKSMITAMGSSTTSLQRWYQLPSLDHTFLYFFFSTLLYISSVTCTATIQPSYTDHCASFLPESTPTSLEFTTSPFLTGFQSGYYRGSRIPNPSLNSSNSLKYLWFRTRDVSYTDGKGLFKVFGSVTLQSPNMNYFFRNMNRPRPVPFRRSQIIGSLSFGLQGFWSQSSGKLCMVGSGSTYSNGGKLLDLGAVLKLNYVKNSSTVTSLVSGTLESLNSANDPKYFEPIFILMFSQMNYNYTLVSKEFSDGCFGGSDIPQSLPLSSQPYKSLCSILPRAMDGFELKYAPNCDSERNCTPFGGNVGFLPRVMFLNAVQCSEVYQRLQVLVEFSNTSSVGFYQSFNLDAALVGEGLWDGKKNQLCVVACRILNTTDSLANARVGDCSIRLGLRFSAIWSIRESSSVVGEIWSNKTVNDSGYFDRILYKSHENRMLRLPGLRYEYTEIDKVPKSCLVNKAVKNKGERYPHGYSNDMRFDMLVKNSRGRFIAWGYSAPLSVGDQFFDQNLYWMPFPGSMPTNYVVPANSSNSSPLNISFKITFTPPPGVKIGGGISLFNRYWSSNMREEISAEGIYDAETGGLCMVGCRFLGSSNQMSTNDSMDCEILFNFQFPPINSKNNGGHIKGSIESRRNKSDPLYFEPLNLISIAFVEEEGKRSIWRMDLEITMVLISKTLACVFVVLQLFYVKRHPHMLPSISLVMLAVLTLGYMIPLMLNFEALFFQNHNRKNVLLGNEEWLEVNEVIIRVVTMVAFLLQFRLLQLTWSAKSNDGSQKDLWAAEKKALFMTSPLYLAGGLIALFANWRKKNDGLIIISSHPMGNHQQHSLWGDLKSYSGLVLDGFLLPQILLNIFSNLRDGKPLSFSFYIGTTFVRLLPHAYDLYRAHNYVRHFVGSYIYANPGADFYSTTWDVIIPLGVLLFATIIYLQQRFGGCFILPQRFRQLEEYEMVPVVSSE